MVSQAIGWLSVGWWSSRTVKRSFDGVVVKQRSIWVAIGRERTVHSAWMKDHDRIRQHRTQTFYASPGCKAILEFEMYITPHSASSTTAYDEFGLSGTAICGRSKERVGTFSGNATLQNIDSTTKNT